MPVFISSHRKSLLLSLATLTLTALLLGHPSRAQEQAPPVGPKPNSQPNRSKFQDSPVLVRVCVLDTRGLPLEIPVQVRLSSRIKAFDLTETTQDSSIADFPDVSPADYQIEVTSIGFDPTTQLLHVANLGKEFSVFVYLRSQSEQKFTASTKLAAPLSPKLQHEIHRGLEYMQKQHYEKARAQFELAARSAPQNPDVRYLQGTAELALHQKDAARKNFELALSLEPAHQRALLALAELQLESHETSAAIDTLEDAYQANGAGWRTEYLLATAYAQANRLPEAEIHASHAVEFAGRSAGSAMMLLADVQYREGKKEDAQKTWQRVASQFPKTDVARAANAKLARMAAESGEADSSSAGILPLASLPGLPQSSPAELPWAPPDIDSEEYPTAKDITCSVEEVLDLAQSRLNSQLHNFEKFTATEHVVHQLIGSSGMPEPSKEKEFSYIVFVYPFAGNSLYLEESRDGGSSYSNFPTSMITTGINSLGVALLQPVNRDSFNYTCEGLTSVRGQAAWQVRFEEKKNTNGAIRRWRDNYKSYIVRVKGRVWLASTSYDMLRIETDLLEPVESLGLTRDHLQVNYGPVSFQDGKEWLWLPWSAEMYMEYRHKRYHHRHFLTDYMLFGVDTSNKIGKPKEPPPPPPEAVPAHP
jgi:tetratricopeptide (TPR) repeat protein